MLHTVDDAKALINNARNIIDFLRVVDHNFILVCSGDTSPSIRRPVVPGRFGVLHTPGTRGSKVNTDLYPFVVLIPLVLQGSQALIIAVPGGEQYKIPTAIIALNFNGGTSTPTFVSDSPVAIVGAGDSSQ